MLYIALSLCHFEFITSDLAVASILYSFLHAVPLGLQLSILLFISSRFTSALITTEWFGSVLPF